MFYIGDKILKNRDANLWRINVKQHKIIFFLNKSITLKMRTAYLHMYDVKFRVRNNWIRMAAKSWFKSSQIRIFFGGAGENIYGISLG